MRIRAAVLDEPRQPLSVEGVELDEPKADEVLVRVAAAGVCRSDLHLAEGLLGDGRWPIVLGHEGAGIVEAVGERVAHVAPGEPVVFSFVPACGSCMACRSGSPHPLRPRWRAWRRGDAAALLGCGVVTGLGAVRNAARVQIGESVCVIGCGGVGLHVVSGAHLAGAAQIIAVDRSPEKLELARRHGATATVRFSNGDGVAAVPHRSRPTRTVEAAA